jgi:hypothetical protein
MHVTLAGKYSESFCICAFIKDYIRALELARKSQAERIGIERKQSMATQTFASPKGVGKGERRRPIRMNRPAKKMAGADQG